MEGKKKRSLSQAVFLLLILGFCLYQQYESNRLVERYNSLVKDYNGLLEKYNGLVEKYNKLSAVALLPPYSKISEGNITWCFYNLGKGIVRWTMPLDTYRYYVSSTKPVERLSLSTVRGGIWTYDLRPYIQPSFFRLVIGDLTSGRLDREFVKEVDNVKNQIVVYGSGLGEAPYQFPAETLTEGRGRCADTTILMASMLIEGNRRAAYNFKVHIWYVQLAGGALVSDSRSLGDANHVIIQVEFSDGSNWSIETTTKTFFTYSQVFAGWKFEVTAIVR